MDGICAACQPIEDELNSIHQQIQQIQHSPGYIQGPTDPHPGRPDPEMLAEVKVLWKQALAASRQLDQCVIQKCGGKPDLNAAFSGTATLTIPSLGVASASAISISLLFHKYDHVSFDVTAFPAIMVPIPGASDTVTITQTGGGSGTFTPASGALLLPLTLHFHHSNILAGDSDIVFNLSTAKPGGSPLDVGGPNLIGVSDVSTFTGGYLGGDMAILLVTGTILPHP